MTSSLSQACWDTLYRPVHAPFELQGLALCTKPSDFGHLIFIGTQSQRNFLKSTILTTAYERHTELL